MSRSRAITGGLVLAVIAIGCVGATEPVDVTRSRPVATGTVPPRLQLESFAGRWERSVVLTLHADDTYEITSDLGTDLGEYRYRKKAGTLRLTTTAGDMCESGDRTRFPVTLEDHPVEDGTRLIMGYELEQCRLRGELPHIYEMPAGTSDGLIGEWTRQVAIEINLEGTYSIVTKDGQDVGAFTYDDWHEALTIETTDGNLCEPGDRSEVFVAKGRLDLNTTLSFEFDLPEGSEPCFARSGLDGLYLDVRD